MSSSLTDAPGVRKQVMADIEWLTDWTDDQTPDQPTNPPSRATAVS
jgi:hypothetical protein